MVLARTMDSKANLCLYTHTHFGSTWAPRRTQSLLHTHWVTTYVAEDSSNSFIHSGEDIEVNINVQHDGTSSN